MKLILKNVRSKQELLLDIDQSAIVYSLVQKISQKLRVWESQVFIFDGKKRLQQNNKLSEINSLALDYIVLNRPKFWPVTDNEPLPKRYTQGMETLKEEEKKTQKIVPDDDQNNNTNKRQIYQYKSQNQNQFIPQVYSVSKFLKDIASDKSAWQQYMQQMNTRQIMQFYAKLYTEVQQNLQNLEGLRQLVLSAPILNDMQIFQVLVQSSEDQALFQLLVRLPEFQCEILKNFRHCYHLSNHDPEMMWHVAREMLEYERDSQNYAQAPIPVTVEEIIASFDEKLFVSYTQNSMRFLAKVELFSALSQHCAQFFTNRQNMLQMLQQVQQQFDMTKLRQILLPHVQNKDQWAESLNHIQYQLVQMFGTSFILEYYQQEPEQLRQLFLKCIGQPYQFSNNGMSGNSGMYQQPFQNPEFQQQGQQQYQQPKSPMPDINTLRQRYQVQLQQIHNMGINLPDQTLLEMLETCGGNVEQVAQMIYEQ